MNQFTEYSDVTSSDFGRAPLAKGYVRAVYLTQLGANAGIEITQAQVDAARAAGTGLMGIDQTPDLSLFASGQSRFGVPCAVADVEFEAGTIAAAVPAVASRQSRGEESVIYISSGNWSAMKAALASSKDVYYVVANWSWSLAAAQNFMTTHPDVRGVQFGDPASNPNTLVPGTNVTLSMAQQDIDVGLTSWLDTFFPAAPKPPTPVPVPKPPTPASNAPRWPFGPLDYLSRPSTDPHCHSGYYSSVDNHVVTLWQQRMKDRGWTIDVDGRFGDQSFGVCEAFQTEKGLTRDGKVGSRTWAASWTAPIT